MVFLGTGQPEQANQKCLCELEWFGLVSFHDGLVVVLEIIEPNHSNRVLVLNFTDSS